MSNLYITSSEVFSGKSALCVGTGMRMRADGLKVGYMKPVNINCPLCDGLAHDEDVVYAKQIFEMSEPFELIGPVALTPARFEQQLRGPEVDYEPKLKEAFAKISASRDVMVLEGGRSLREGYIAGLPPKKVVELLDAKVLVVLKYDDTLMIDRALAAQDYFGERMTSVVFNEVPRTRLEFVEEAVTPFLTRRGIQVLGALRLDPLLMAPTVIELAEGLNAEILCAPEKSIELVEHMLIGAMSAESALAYFRRKNNKAVITGGDRADIQMAALETSTRCLILTGNLYPSPAVIRRAEELEVPVLLTDLDTLSAVETTEGYFGRSRFQQAQKTERFMGMLNEYFDFAALYEILGVRAG
jgi:BioD-like phosphotransacetylase family protein